MDVTIESKYTKLNETWDDIYQLQNQLYETRDSEFFDEVVGQLRKANKSMNNLQKEVDDLHTARRVAEEARNTLQFKAVVEELKGEADYRALFVSRLNEEVAAENKKAADAVGTDDEDLYKREAELITAWYKEILEY
jgi:hypothetical protein